MSPGVPIPGPPPQHETDRHRVAGSAGRTGRRHADCSLVELTPSTGLTEIVRFASWENSMNRYWTPPLLVLACLITAQAPAGGKKTERPALDREFLIQAVTCNHAEVKFSELAERNASNPKVKEFARKMVKEHTQSSEALAKMADN